MTTKHMKELIVKELLEISERLGDLVVKNSVEPEEIAEQLRECASALELAWETDDEEG